MPFEEITTGSIIVIMFSVSMVVVSAVSLIDIVLASNSVKKSRGGKVISFGWILVGTGGIGMIALVTTDTTISVPLAFVGLLFTLSLLSYEAILYNRSGMDDRVRPSAQWLLNHTRGNK
ncbi:hypothetical protein [Natronobiforma cellulositropha]|uniref:hypothetical protein n=1 Tax=Natronobiforma cellulositropha TaxID=1679076 RepID=UPI0021D5844B|nr:hypothetical protein [Natronobiforma cellulositropha]